MITLTAIAALSLTAWAAYERDKDIALVAILAAIFLLVLINRY